MGPRVGSPGRAWTFALVAMACSALLGLPACAESGQPDVQSGASVEVDIFSGLENPIAPLGPDAFHDLEAFVDGQEYGAEEAEVPAGTLGFRGLVVTPDGPHEEWSSIRVLVHEVYVTGDDGAFRITDDSGVAFDIIWENIHAHLDEPVVTAVEESQ